MKFIIDIDISGDNEHIEVTVHIPGDQHQGGPNPPQTIKSTRPFPFLEDWLLSRRVNSFYTRLAKTIVKQINKFQENPHDRKNRRSRKK